MKASISFPELQNLLLEKASTPLSFGFVNDKTISVTYPLNLGFIKKDVTADLTIVDMDGSDLLVHVDAGRGTETLLNTALGILWNKLPEGMIEKRPDSHLLVHLGQIEQVKSVFDAIRVDDIHVLGGGLEVEGGLK